MVELEADELGDGDAVLSPGSHAFVRCYGEKVLRCTYMAFDFGFAGGHPLLTNSNMVNRRDNCTRGGGLCRQTTHAQGSNFESRRRERRQSFVLFRRPSAPIWRDLP